MQCPSCQFENMPGSNHCARCGALVALSSFDIDVHPPRATPFAKRLPARPLAIANQLRNFVNSAVHRVVGNVQSLPEFGGKWSDWWSLVAPGLRQIRRGERRRGKLLMGVFTGLLLLSLVLAGTAVGSLLLGLLFAVHVASTVDASVRHFSSTAVRIRFTLVTAAALACAVYAPSLWLVSRAATPISIALDTREFQAGDVVWYNRSAVPRVGDMVFYRVPPTTLTGTGVRYATQFRIEGERMNRLIAREGDVVRWADGKLLVNGFPSAWQPTAPIPLPVGLDIQVPRDSVFILPENLLPRDAAVRSADAAVALVPLRFVQGPVFLRSYPISRFTFF